MDLKTFESHLQHLLEVANQDPRFVEVDWSPVIWESIPSRVDLIVTYEPNGARVIVQNLDIDARVVIDRNEQAPYQHVRSGHGMIRGGVRVGKVFCPSVMETAESKRHPLSIMYRKKTARKSQWLHLRMGSVPGLLTASCNV
jgi:hypothetical protein